MPLLYVKKLFSLNPTMYKSILLEQGLKEYYQYCMSHIRILQGLETYKGKHEKLKTFREWLKTEI